MYLTIFSNSERCTLLYYNLRQYNLERSFDTRASETLAYILREKKKPVRKSTKRFRRRKKVIGIIKDPWIIDYAEQCFLPY